MALRLWLFLFCAVASAQVFPPVGGSSAASGWTRTGTTLAPTTATDTLSLTGTVGVYGGSGAGTGILGIGGPAVKGYGIYLDIGSANIVDTGEYIGAQFSATNTPTSASTGAPFGVVALGQWAGSANSSAGGLVYGGQFTAQVAGTPSLSAAYGLEATVSNVATAGTTTYAYSIWAHNHTVSTALITNSEAVRADVTGSGTTNAIAFHSNALAAVNAYGLKVESVTGGSTLNYAIWTDLGLVHIGDKATFTAAAAFTGGITGVLQVGLGTEVNNQVSVKVGTTPSINPLQVTNNAGTVIWNVGSTGGMNIGADTSFAENTAIFGAGQAIRISAGAIDMASTLAVEWAVDSHAYDTKDTRLSRASAGVVSIDTTTLGNGLGSLKAAGAVFSGASITIGGHVCTAGTGTFTCT